ncbi:MAG: hypothetical protein ACQETE_02475 [Bacteroidota bacterium]
MFNSDFSKQVIEDELAGTPLVIVGSSDLDLAAAYRSELADGTPLQFQAVQDELPVVMTDQRGNRWSIFG